MLNKLYIVDDVKLLVFMCVCRCRYYVLHFLKVAFTVQPLVYISYRLIIWTGENWSACSDTTYARDTTNYVQDPGG